MRIKRKYLYLSVIGLVLAAGGVTLLFYHSNPRVVRPEVVDTKRDVSDNLKQINKFLAEKDQERIRSFIRRRGWDMKRTGSGLWYTVYRDGEGEQIREGMYVKMNYEIRLLDGTLCYTSDSTGAKIFRVGHQEETQGLYIGLKLLREGDQARLIMPPHLGHGLVGDGERIPARAILVYDLTILEASPDKIRR